MMGKGMSGGDKRMIEILKRFKTYGIPVILLTPEMGRNIFNKMLDVQYTVTPYSKYFDKYGIIVGYLMRTLLACFCFKSNHDDILYSSSDFLPDVVPAFFFRHKLKKSSSAMVWVQLIHHIIPHYSHRSGPLIKNIMSYYEQRLSFLFIKKFSDLIIVVNPFVKIQLQKLGFEEKKIIISSNGVDNSFLATIKANKGKQYDAVFLGRLSVSKGIFDLVEIWKIVDIKRPDSNLAIIGGATDSKIQDELSQKIKSAGVKIDILGFLDDNDAFSIIKSSHLFVSASHEEGFGITLLEAMMCGLPIVAWDLRAYSVFSPETMIKIPVGRIQLFAEKVVELLSDEHIRRSYAERSPDMSKYSWDSIASNEFQYIQQFLEHNKR